MKSKLLLFAFLFAFLSTAALAQLSGNYYIGGVNTPNYATLAAACTAINAQGVSAPVTFLIDADLAETAAGLSINTSALAASLQISRTNTLTIKPNTSTTRNITITGTGTGAFTITSTNYVIIDGSNGSGSSLTFTLNVPAATYGIYILGSSHITIQNCSITSQIAPTYSAIYAIFNGSVLSDSLIFQNTIINSTSGVAPVKYGIYTKGIAGTNFSSAQIRNNTIYALNVGIDLNYFTATGITSEVSGNTIYLGTTLAIGYIEAIYFADYGGTINIFKNKVLQVSSAGGATTTVMYGIATNYLALPSTTLNIYNNFITGFALNAAYTGTVCGVYLGDPSGAVRPTVNLFYNTIYMNSTGGLATGNVSAINKLVTTSAQTITMKNNILYNENGTATSYAVYYPGTTGTLVSDYNDLYVTGSGNVGYFNAANCLDLAAWKTASAGDANSVSRSVTFASIVPPFDLHLASGSIGDAGLTGIKVPGYTTDIDGETRSTIYPYEGADEGAWLLYPIAVEGDLSNSQYITLATKLNTNYNWGASLNVSKIVYYPDVAHGVLYIGVEALLDNTGFNGIGMMIGFSELAGVPAGTTLGGTASGGHFMGDATNPNFKADFPVSYMMAINPGSGANCYVNAVKLVGTRTASYLGNCFQTSFAISGPGGASDFWSQNSVSFAYNNSGAANKGFEIRIPFSELGITSAGNIQMFAFVVSATAYFSEITVPGNIASDPGNNADFSTLSGGPFHGSLSPLPVELSSFTAHMNGNAVVLNWKTATEQNNNIFEIERSSNGSTWVKIGSVQGSGNSNSVKSYSFSDSKLSITGKYSYRLKQVDNNGSSKYSNVTEVNYTVPTVFSLSQNYPNPFNPSTIISYSLPQASNVKLSVYNALGQMVKVLENESKEAGIYNISFNASELSSGIYFYKIEAGQFSQTRKMMLVK